MTKTFLGNPVYISTNLFVYTQNAQVHHWQQGERQTRFRGGMLLHSATSITVGKSKMLTSCVVTTADRLKYEKQNSLEGALMRTLTVVRS